MDTSMQQTLSNKVISTTTQPIILFDGVCNLCNDSVQQIIKRDPKGKFLFASLQSEVGQALLKKFNRPTTDLDTIVLVEGERHYIKSTAALRIARRLKGLWPLLYGFIIIPGFIRHSLYNYVARNRYRWYGKQDQCMMPTPELKARFIG